MTSTELLQKCNKKYTKRNQITSTEYRLPITEFLMELYLKCTPASYGKKFPLKLLGDCQRHDIYVRDIPDNENCGDIRICYPMIDGSSPGWFDLFLGNATLNEISEYRIEIKTSYLTKNNIYNIKGIRLYQDFDFYLLCFIDCKDNFRPRFTCIDKDVLQRSESITLTPLSGTKKSNLNNENIVYSATIKKDSFIDDMLFDWVGAEISGYNLLKDDTYESLLAFLSFLNKKAITDYLNNSETKKKILKGLNDQYRNGRLEKKYTYLSKKKLFGGNQKSLIDNLNDIITKYNIDKEEFYFVPPPNIREWWNRDTNTWSFVQYP
tara:strand:+ start:2281 stop:3246 length:966 start_codon:yes stop_codon:yes gene_type:complete